MAIKDQDYRTGALAGTSEWFPNATNRTVMPCSCIGPQDGRPLCPCAMRGVVIRDGRYIVPEKDLGAVVPADRLTP